MNDLSTNIILFPASFGYGPATHAIAIAQNIQQQKLKSQVYIIVDDNLRSFISNTKIFSNKNIISVSDLDDFSEVKNRNLVVLITNNESIPVIRNLNYDILIVDALLWMWKELPSIPNNILAYLALSFPGVNERIKELSQNVYSEQIDQISIDFSIPNKVKSGVVINIGGGFTPLGCSYSYLASVVNDIIAVLERNDIVITCSPICRDELIKLGVKTEILSLDPFQMLYLLSCSDTLITLPGLSIIWDAIFTKIRTIVIPGISYSQHLQPKSYHSSISNLPILFWGDIPGYNTLESGIEESIAMQQALSINNRFSQDVQGRNFLKNWLRLQMESIVGYPLISSLQPYGKFNGSDQVVTHVKRWLEERNN